MAKSEANECRRGNRDAIDGKGIVRKRPGELRRVEIGTGRLQYLADRLELTNMIGAVQHRRHHLLHRVKGCDLGTRSVGVLPDADTHVQPCIAIDDVVATATHHDVAAVATQDDVAGGEGRDMGAEGCIEELLQAVDQRDIRQRAAVHACADFAADQIDRVVASQEVVMARAGEAFHDVKTGKSRRARTRHLRLVEEPAGEVDGDADVIVLVGRPVEARATEESIGESLAADHDVVTAFADELVVLAVAEEDVVAGNRIVTERIEVIARRSVRRAFLDPVVALVADILLVRLVAEDKVVSGAAEGFRIVLTGDDEITAESAEDEVGAVSTLDDVVAVASLDVIEAAGIRDDIVARATTDVIVAISAVEPI